MRPIDGDSLHLKVLKDNNFDFSRTETVAQILLRIEKEPPVDFNIEKHGRWIEKEHYSVHGEEYCDCICSECSHRISRVRGYYPNYCEDCGSKMNNKVK